MRNPVRIRGLRQLALLVVLNLGLAAKAYAPLSAHVTLSTLASAADVILVGRVTASATPEPGPYSIDVDRVLKGKPGANTLRFRGSEEPLFNPPGEPTPYGLMFLKRQTGTEGGEAQWIALGTWTGAMMLREHVLPALPGDLPAAYAPSGDATVLDAVVGEIRYAVASETDPDRLGAGYHALFSLQATRESDVAHPQGQTANALKTMGLRLVRQLRDLQDADEPLPGRLTMLLCLVKDAEAVPHLGALFTAPTADALTRSCALQALRAIHSEASLPFLAAALDSDDREVAYQGLMGLSAYALGAPGGDTRGPIKPGLVPAVLNELSVHSPSVPLFDTDPNSYIDYWRGWWKCQACRLGRPECFESVCAARRGYRPN